MTQTQISCFKAVAQFRSFSKAAQHLMISQPAVSQNISKLEMELNLVLFDRTGKAVQLTEAGALLVEFFTRLQIDFKNALAAARAKQDAFSGAVRLGFPNGWEIDPFYSMLNAFQAQYPNIHIELVNVPMEDLEDALISGGLDAAITAGYVLRSSQQLTSRTLLSSRNLILYSRNMSFPAGHVPTLLDFRNCAFYLVAANNLEPFRQAVRRECSKYGFEPNMVPCANLSTALFYVQNNQGVFLGSEFIAAKDNIRYFDHLVLDAIQNPVLLAWNKDITPGPVKFFVNETLYNGSIVAQYTK